MSRETLLITGAAGSLGSALSLLAARRGFNLALIDRDRRGLERLGDQILESDCPEPALQVLDLATAGPDGISEIVQAIEQEFGGLDAVVHCAARFESLTPLEHVPPEEWLHTMQVNLNAAWLISSMCLQLLRESNRGRLYFLVEDLDAVGGPFWGPYGVSKHAVQAMAGQFAAECRSSGIQVLGINPGPMRSPLRSRAYLAENPATQPAPEIAARRIVALLTGEREPAGTFVDLPARDAIA